MMKHPNDRNPGFTTIPYQYPEVKADENQLEAPRTIAIKPQKRVSAHLKRSIARRIAARSMLNRAANRLIKINPSHRCG